MFINSMTYGFEQQHVFFYDKTFYDLVLVLSVMRYYAWICIIIVRTFAPSYSSLFLLGLSVIETLTTAAENK